MMLKMSLLTEKSAFPKNQIDCDPHMSHPPAIFFRLKKIVAMLISGVEVMWMERIGSCHYEFQF